MFTSCINCNIMPPASSISIGLSSISVLHLSRLALVGSISSQRAHPQLQIQPCISVRLRPRGQRHDVLFRRCQITSDYTLMCVIIVLYLPEPYVVRHLLHQHIVINHSWVSFEQPGEVGQFKPTGFIQL